MIKKLIVTEASYKIRKEKYDKFTKRILDVQKDKEEARSQGDLSENFGYVEAKKTEENLRRMQADLELDLPLEIVDPHQWAALDMEDMPRAMLGAQIKIKRNGQEENLLIGGAWDAELDNVNVIPYTSPLAKSLIPKQPGFKTTLETNGDTIELITSTVPKKETLEALYTKSISKDNSKPKQSQNQTQETPQEQKNQIKQATELMSM